MTLDERLHSRDNAITALRLGLAALVVLGHAYEAGGFGADPLQVRGGVTLGELGVNSFFALSGFLITRSFLSSRSTRSYLWKRALRILPAFWACLLVTGLGLFPLLQHARHGASWPAAILQPQFLTYVTANAALKITQNGVGELFARHPAAGVANGALWSLFPGALCCGGIMVAGWLGLLRDRGRAGLFALFLAAFAFQIITPDLLERIEYSPQFGAVWYLTRVNTQAVFFLGGALMLVFAERMPVHRLATIGAALVLAWAMGRGDYAIFGPFLLPWLLLNLAVWLPLASWARLGDYAYGLYLYHFPVQQTLFLLGLRPSGPWKFFCLTLAITMPLAWLSWHLVELPALSLRKPPAEPPRPSAAGDE
jgi:peptidoglycan/LPS O-acetylase OafA/YrhL